METLMIFIAICLGLYTLYIPSQVDGTMVINTILDQRVKKMNNFVYLVIISGGIGEDVWDREITITAESMLEAVQTISKKLGYMEDIVSIERVD